MANNKPIFVGEIYGKNVTLTDTTLTDIFVGDVSLCTRVDVIAITTDEASNQTLDFIFMMALLVELLALYRFL